MLKKAIKQAAVIIFLSGLLFDPVFPFSRLPKKTHTLEAKDSQKSDKPEPIEWEYQRVEVV